jgi:hypothetical protein
VAGRPVGLGDGDQAPLQRRSLQRAGLIGEIEHQRERERRQGIETSVRAPDGEVLPVEVIGSLGVLRPGGIEVGTGLLAERF